MTSIVVGFILRYLPALFTGVSDYFGKKSDHKNEMEMMRLSSELELVRSKTAAQSIMQSAEINQSILALQAEVANVTASITDRTSAREYQTKIVSMMDSTLSKGKELGVYKWLLSVGWTTALFIECLSASVQPCIAVCAFSMWIYYRIKTQQGFGIEDWALIEAVVGFYLAGRVQKFFNSKEK